MRPGWAAALALLWLLPVPARGDADALRARAEAGDPVAQVDLGLRMARGSKTAPPDLAEAFRWYRRAAAQGDPRAKLRLSRAYEKGEGVAQDDVAAVDWLMQAADEGNVRAMVLLGERFQRGQGVAQSPVLAYLWHYRAARLGSPLGLFRSGGLARVLSPEERQAAEGLARIQAERTRRMGVRPASPVE